MPVTNGDAARNTSASALTSDTPLDHATALKVLESEYPSRDGLNIHDLLDSHVHGGLTYNDFLILPGYVGTMFPPPSSCVVS